MADFIQKLIDNIPDYQQFLTVDEMDENSKKLAAEFPDIVEIFEAGKSRKGHPIYCLKIGKGSRNALMFGCPHPNEPMGAMLLEYFSRALAEDEGLRSELDYTWYLIKSIDLDGTQLNEGWFKGPITLTNFTRHYFRPAGYEQVEWNFPFHYKNYTYDTPIPETVCLMNLIDKIQPQFMYSLHNAGFGGTYWYLTREIPELWDKFYTATAKQDIPLHLGEPEVNYITPFSQAIYPMISSKDTYDYNEKYGTVAPEKLMSTGTSSADYALQQGYDTTTLVTELPYFYEPRIQSDKLMDFSRREAALKGREILHENRKAVKLRYDQIADLISDDNGFAKMVSNGYEHFEEDYRQECDFIRQDSNYDDLCKESEAFDNLEIPKYRVLLQWTLLIRACEHELAKNPSLEAAQRLQRIHDEGEKEFAKRAEIAEKELHYEVIPIRKLIAVQLESGMLVADYLQKNR